MKKAIVIGAGIGGLSAAIRLAVKGYAVEVFDKNSGPGGKLTQFELGKYRFDFGPSLFTMPTFVEELFEISGKNPADYFSYQSLETACHYFFPDGKRFNAPTDPKKFSVLASEIFEVDQKKIDRYFEYNTNILENAGWIFLNNSMHKPATFLNKNALKAVMQQYVIELFRTMHGTTKKMIGEPHLVQLFDRYSTYNGSSPYHASAILNSISILEHLHGTYFPNGGMYAITMAVFRLAEELGVQFYFNQTVTRITKKQRRVTGIEVAATHHPADIVVSNMDVTFTYQKLLGKGRPPKLYRAGDKSSSAVIFYWGMACDPAELGLHNILFSKDYPEEFDAIFNRKTVGTDPTVYINISSKHSPEDAPDGHSNWFVMINAPADNGQDWDALIAELRQRVIQKINTELEMDVESVLEEEYIADPRVIQEKTLSHQGALYGQSSNHWLSAFLRHPNFSQSTKGLYFVGGSVHPGGGIPLCLLSSKIATSVID